jgi:outer membrane protein assembly factor BamB
MNISRRNFHKISLQFLAGISLPEIVNQVFNWQIPDQQVSNSLQNLLTYIINEETQLLIPTFLGNDQRRFYGRGEPKDLKVLNKFPLGSGVTYVGSTKKYWGGAGWTGQPTMVKDQRKTYLIIGAFDHTLRKIDAETNQLIWQYQFDDVVKGTASIYIDETADADNKIVILQGSRSSRPGRSSNPSLRAISLRTGQEIWRLNIKKTKSYSQDNDSSPLYLGDGLVFNSSENGIGYFLPSSTTKTELKSGMKQPQIISEVILYENSDIQKHGGNLVTESSPARLDNRLFVASGSGHIYGIDIQQKKTIWDFYTGSDMDGSIVISTDGKLFGAIEKQYIAGAGGIIKLNPNLPPEDAVEWFLPTANRKFNTWEGGVIGSAAINDEYNSGEYPAIVATNAIDGNLYIASQQITTGEKVWGPLKNRKYDTPVILFKDNIGASISTPIFTDGNKLISATYNGVYLFQLNWQKSSIDNKSAIPNQKGEYYQLEVNQLAHFLPGISFEATPIVWDGIVRICGRDGWLYSLG